MLRAVEQTWNISFVTRQMITRAARGTAAQTVRINDDFAVTYVPGAGGGDNALAAQFLAAVGWKGAPPAGNVLLHLLSTDDVYHAWDLAERVTKAPLRVAISMESGAPRRSPEAQAYQISCNLYGY